MASATLNVRLSPRRMLSTREAAEYCGLPVKLFSSECGAVPVLMPSGRKLYDMQDLDNWLDGLKSGQPNEDEAILGRLRA
ncbi:hypothetical protein AAFN47_11090 [Hoeflea sp. CAU 1731]